MVLSSVTDATRTTEAIQMFIHSNATHKVNFRAVRAIFKGEDGPSYVCEDHDGFYLCANIADDDLVRRLSDIDEEWLANHPEITFQEVKVEILYTSTVTEIE